jgi:GNAT superfamily N-acetyltransferase
METNMDTQYGTLLISDEQGLLNIPFIHQFLSHSYWAQNIPIETVEKSISNSVSFGIYLNGVQIGFARVITDKTTFAYLADVFITEEQRGKGYSKLLLAFVHQHPELQGLRRWMLGTRDAHKLYEQFGWTQLSMPERFMQKHNPNIYR